MFIAALTVGTFVSAAVLPAAAAYESQASNPPTLALTLQDGRILRSEAMTLTPRLLVVFDGRNVQTVKGAQVRMVRIAGE